MSLLAGARPCSILPLCSPLATGDARPPRRPGVILKAASAAKPPILLQVRVGKEPHAAAQARQLQNKAAFPPSETGALRHCQRGPGLAAGRDAGQPGKARRRRPRNCLRARAALNRKPITPKGRKLRRSCGGGLFFDRSPIVKHVGPEHRAQKPTAPPEPLLARLARGPSCRALAVPFGRGKPRAPAAG